MAKDARYWQGQISSAKSENKTFISDAESCDKAYSEEKSYNIFYSNTNILTSNLLINSPKPDIQRRFIKKTENEKLKYNTYLNIAKISESVLSYYSDISDIQEKFKETIKYSVKNGRGVTWIEYEPVISKKVILDSEGQKTEQEVVSDRNFIISSLSYRDFLVSTAEKKEDVWWVARRHTLTKEEVKKRFNKKLDETVFSMEDKETQKRRAEIWEIWDKTAKERYFILENGKNEFLEEQKDPYKLEGFFPCDWIHWLDNGKNIVPIPEYKIYRKKALELDSVSAKSDLLEEKINLIIVTANQNKDITDEIANASNGDVISLKSLDPTGNVNVNNLVSIVPVDGALNIINHCTAKKLELKNDIYDITGISDIQRGQSDAQETATAQKIKGLFGSLRFQSRQKVIQNHIRKIYSIITEVICEHWDSETLEEITSITLPTEEDKMRIKQEQMVLNQISNNPEAMQLAKQNGLKLPSEEEISLLEQPTWEQIIGFMRDDKLRNYTIDIETTATIFDDKTQQQASIQALTQSYLNLVSQAVNLQDPNLIKGFLPIMRLNLSSIKAGRSISMQLEEALEGAYKSLEEKQKQAPAPSPEMEKIKMEQTKWQAEQQYKAQEMQIRSMEAQNKQQELALKQQEFIAKQRLEEKKLQEKAMNDLGLLKDKQNQTDIKQQEANRKDSELKTETELSLLSAQTGQGVDTNIGIG